MAHESLFFLAPATASAKYRETRPIRSFAIESQPDDTTCGPTCLHAVYRFHGDNMPLPELVRETRLLTTGGTLAVFLGCHALERGYRATMYTFNLQIFDPTWFDNAGIDLSAKLSEQMQYKNESKFSAASNGYLEFLRLGGTIRYMDLTRDLLRHYLRRSVPILAGLSATHLYRCSRERGQTDDYDDVQGEPVGHFVVLYGYEPSGKHVWVADPLHTNPLAASRYYPVPIDRVIGAILLGIVTYDANVLVLEPGPTRRRS